MTTLYHPTLSSTVEVAEKSVKKWTDQGWRKTPPTTNTPGADAAGQASVEQEGNI